MLVRVQLTTTHASWPEKVRARVLAGDDGSPAFDRYRCAPPICWPKLTKFDLFKHKISKGGHTLYLFFLHEGTEELGYDFLCSNYSKINIFLYKLSLLNMCRIFVRVQL